MRPVPYALEDFRKTYADFMYMFPHITLDTLAYRYMLGKPNAKRKYNQDQLECIIGLANKEQIAGFKQITQLSFVNSSSSSIKKIIVSIERLMRQCLTGDQYNRLILSPVVSTKAELYIDTPRSSYMLRLYELHSNNCKVLIGFNNKIPRWYTLYHNKKKEEYFIYGTKRHYIKTFK